jgi:hypothetical protein
MNEAYALALFEKKLGAQGDGKHVTELAAALDFMLLAQAAAYISQQVPRYSVRQYLEEFQKSDRKKKKPPQPRRGTAPSRPGGEELHHHHLTNIVRLHTSDQGISS